MYTSSNHSCLPFGATVGFHLYVTSDSIDAVREYGYFDQAEAGRSGFHKNDWLFVTCKDGSAIFVVDEVYKSRESRGKDQIILSEISFGANSKAVLTPPVRSTRSKQKEDA